jgi:acyl carrier protein
MECLIGIDLLDISFRLERRFGVKVTHDDFMKLFIERESRDIVVGDLFALVHQRMPSGGIVDSEVDADVLWLIFQSAISDTLGVDHEDITKDAGLFRDLGAE